MRPMRNTHTHRLAALALATLLTPIALAQTPKQVGDQAQACIEAAALYRETTGRDIAAENPPVIAMYKSAFCPPRLTVRAGTTVRFLNLDRRTSHSVWLRDAGKPETERAFSGEALDVTVDLSPGEHRYLCGPHWEREGMIGIFDVVP
jgi:plastocyanin